MLDKNLDYVPLKIEKHYKTFLENIAKLNMKKSKTE